MSAIPTSAPVHGAEQHELDLARQRRNMSLVWWSTYLTLVGILLYVFFLNFAAIAFRPSAAAYVTTGIIGVTSLLCWAAGLLRIRRGVSRAAVLTPFMGVAAILGIVCAVLAASVGPRGVYAALPLAVVVMTAGLQPEHRWRWLFLVAAAIPPVYLLVCWAMGVMNPTAMDVAMTIQYAGIVLLAIPSSLWVWGVMLQLEAAQRRAADLAIANERLRFAADLHDVQGHHLQVISLTTDLAARLLGKQQYDAAREQVLAAHAGAQEALRDTRSLVQGYRSTTLVGELENASSVLGAAGIHTDVDLPPMLRTWAGRSRPFPDSTEDGRGDTVTSNVLGLVVREGTTNILRHSHASSARISLRLISSTGRDDDAAPTGRAARRRRLPGGDAHLELVIHNDGASPSSESTPDASTGNGLAGLRERLSALGGTLTYTFDPAHAGFTLTARVPMTGDDHE
ncbi:MULTISPECIES: sensor histidine kinase [Kocuria]|uniref:sensor histidine kinase n=1 Tax=Kocuria TaxID=57493 RepID=UPI0028A1B97A|nr:MULTISPECIES: histidine kinase [Kocuria]MCT1736181.1 histidine kinase [Kocuria marina]